MLPWVKGELFTRQSKRHCRWYVWPGSRGPEIRFVTLVMRPWNSFCNSLTTMILTFKWSLFFSWSMFDAPQLPAYTACFRLPKKRSTGCSWGTVRRVWGLSTIPPVLLLKELHALVASFTGLEKLHDLPLVECYAFLPEGLSVAGSWSTTWSWVLNQALQQGPPSGDLTRHLRACTGAWNRLFCIQPSSLLFFYLQMTGERG